MDIADSSNPDEADGRGTETSLRIWPAVLIVAAHFVVVLVAKFAGATTLGDMAAFGYAPLAAAGLLALWWLLASRAPQRDRALGLLLFTVALGAVYLSHPRDGVFILIAALPTATTSLVVALAVSGGLRWPLRRWLAVGVVAVCALLFCALRVDGVQGNLFPRLAWRWLPAPDALMALPAPGGVADVPASARRMDWPEFRGALRDSRSGYKDFAGDWETPPAELWRRPVGLGWSSFAAVGGYLFTQEQRGEEELVTCYAADTGAPVWANAVTIRFDEVMGSAGPRATPTYHQGKLYTLGATGVLQCIEASTGETVWKRDLAADVEGRVPEWGFSSSPFVKNGLVIVFAGGKSDKSVVAYRSDSGEIAWAAGAGNSGYSSGQWARIARVSQILMASNFGIQAFVPETGGVLWEHAWAAKKNPRVVQPMVIGLNEVLLGTAGGQGTRRLHIEKGPRGWTVEEKWTARGFRPYFNDFVYYKGHCYGFDGNRLTCIDVLTGERQWRGDRCGGQVLLLEPEAKLLVLTEKGAVMIVEATPEAYAKVMEFQALSGKTWNHPVISRDKLFVRNDQEMACFAFPFDGYSGAS